MKHHRKNDSATPGSPFLTHIALREDRVTPGVHPFDLPMLGRGVDLTLSSPVTFFVGENGSGKSTLLEALAWIAGFASQGGNRDHRYAEDDTGKALGRALSLSWRQKVAGGFFMRAETFFNFASYLEGVGSTFRAYGGVSLHEQSHGEAFLALFRNRFEDGLYLLDEPEAALSPQRQLAFLGILHELTRAGSAQFIIATHSPILLAFPGATILSFDGDRLAPIDYRDTEHYRITRDFLEAPERFFRYLFDDGQDSAAGALGLPHFDTPARSKLTPVAGFLTVRCNCRTVQSHSNRTPFDAVLARSSDITGVHCSQLTSYTLGGKRANCSFRQFGAQRRRCCTLLRVRPSSCLR